MSSENKENDWSPLQIRSDVRKRLNLAKAQFQLAKPDEKVTLIRTIELLLDDHEEKQKEASK